MCRPKLTKAGAGSAKCCGPVKLLWAGETALGICGCDFIPWNQSRYCQDTGTTVKESETAVWWQPNCTQKMKQKGVTKVPRQTAAKASATVITNFSAYTGGVRLPSRSFRLPRPFTQMEWATTKCFSPVQSYGSLCFSGWTVQLPWYMRAAPSTKQQPVLCS